MIKNIVELGDHENYNYINGQEIRKINDKLNKIKMKFCQLKFILNLCLNVAFENIFHFLIINP